MSLARRQRREMAKYFGYLGKNETLDALRERIQRSQKMGNQIHIQNLERIQNEVIESRRQRQVTREEELVSGISSSGESTNENVILEPAAFDFLKNLTKEKPLASGDENGTDVNG